MGASEQGRQLEVINYDLRQQGVRQVVGYSGVLSIQKYPESEIAASRNGQLDGLEESVATLGFLWQVSVVWT